MNETQLTITGNLVDDPELRFTPSGQPVAKFRVASTPRYVDKQANAWKGGRALSCARGYPLAFVPATSRHALKSRPSLPSAVAAASARVACIWAMARRSPRSAASSSWASLASTRSSSAAA